jgi:hypothetical protein
MRGLMFKTITIFTGTLIIGNSVPAQNSSDILKGYEKLITPVTGRAKLVKIGIDATKKKVLQKTLHGMNNNFVFLPYTATSEVYNKYAEPLRYTLIRWPGGSSANAYNWKNASFDKWFFGKILRSAYQGPKELQYIEEGKIKIRNRNLNTIDDYITFCKRYKKTPIIVANALKDSKSMVAMLKYFKAKGLQTPYVELGNELYYKGYEKWTGTVGKFSKKIKRICAAINKFDPNIIIILPVGGNHLGTATPLGNPSQLSSNDIENPNLKRQFQWNECFSKMDDFSGITVHHYAGYYLNKAQRNIIKQAMYEKKDRRIAFQYLFAEAYFAPGALTEFFKKYYPNKKMFLSEWGVMGLTRWQDKHKGFPWFQTWGHTLFTTEFLLRLLAMGDTWEGANYHILTGRIFELFSYGYIRKNGKTYWDEKKMFKRMPYYGFEMIGKFLSKNTCIFETKVQNSPMQEGLFNWQGRKYPMLTAYACGDSNGKIKSLFIINKDSQSIKIQLKKMKTANPATLEGLYCKKLADNFGDAFRIKEGIITEKELFRINKSIDISKPVTIPPYFLGIINF